ncbi:MAG: hypothetical protein GWP18_04010 [Proteobacteria bacterium]|nr:hypothetical protein [Pseudomonadota bacterium]
MSTWRTRSVVIALLLTLLGAACQDRVGGSVPRLTDGRILSIVNGRSVELVSESTHQQVWRLEVDTVLYESGEFSIAGIGQVDLGSPTAVFDLTMDRQLVITPGAEYAVMLITIGTDRGRYPDVFDWYAMAMIDDADQPVEGTPDELALDLSVVRLATDDSLLAAAVEFAKEADSIKRRPSAFNTSDESSTMWPHYRAVIERSP